VRRRSPGDRNNRRREIWVPGPKSPMEEVKDFRRETFLMILISESPKTAKPVVGTSESAKGLNRRREIDRKWQGLLCHNPHKDPGWTFLAISK